MGVRQRPRLNAHGPGGVNKPDWVHPAWHDAAAPLAIDPEYAPAMLSVGSLEYQYGRVEEGMALFLKRPSRPSIDQGPAEPRFNVAERSEPGGDVRLGCIRLMLLGRGPRADATTASEDADIRPSRSEPVPIVTQKKRVGKLQAGASLYANGVFHRSLGQAQASGASLCAAPGNRLAGSAAELKSHQPSAVGRGRNLAARDHCDPRRGST